MAHDAARGHSHDHAHNHAGEKAHGHAHGHDHSHGGHPHGAHSHEAHSHSAHSHGAHSHSHGASENRLAIAAALTGLFMVVEIAGGLIAGSLALIADAGHMLSDFASLVFAWLAFRIARRPADAKRTYGFRRFSVLAAFVNGLALFAVAGWIVIEAAMRLATPHEVMAGAMLWIAIGGLIINIISFAVLHGADRSSLNVRGALLHVAGDLLGSVAAILAAVIIMTTGWTAADPLLSVFVALILLKSAWGLVKESGHILLEGAPGHVDIDAISRDLTENVPGVVNVHHAHAWSIDEQQPMMTMHARIIDGASGPAIVQLIKKRLQDKHGVGHATVEIETAESGADCGDPDCR